MSRILFTNGRIFDGRAFHDDKAVLVEGTRISCVCDARNALSANELKDVNVVDLEGRLLAPGFIDVQVNGGGGVLFNETPTVDGLRIMLAAHRKFGTTTLLPTLITDSWEKMLQAAWAVREGIALGLPGLRGVHFEGPYISSKRKGVHDPAFIRQTDAGAVELLTSGDMGRVLLTVAPEEVAPMFIRELADGGVLVCAGHTAGCYDDMRKAVRAGLRGVTHLFNAMTPFGSREPGIVGAALDHDDIWCGLIVDGYHIHDASLRVAIAAKKRCRMMLVTDAMPPVGAPSAEFDLLGTPISVEAGRCVTADGTLAGSALDMATAVRNTVERLGLSHEEALRMASLYPAEFLGLKLGRIEPEYEADFVLLDGYDVVGTWIGGENAESDT